MLNKELVDTYDYTFGTYKITARKYKNVMRWSWSLNCQDCGQVLPIVRKGTIFWEAKCTDCKIEYVLTPCEIHKSTQLDLEEIM